MAPTDTQAAENMILGKTAKGGPAAVMQSAATINLQHGAVGRGSYTPVARDQAAAEAEAEIGGNRIIIEAVGEQVVGQYVEPGKVDMTDQARAVASDPVTVGEALETAALSAGNKSIDYSDAAAIQAAEVGASGYTSIGGAAAVAQCAAYENARMTNEENKIKLGDSLADASNMLETNKPVTREIAEGVAEAEIRNNPDMVTHPGGISATMAAAARLNQDPTS